jgi:hypothetical protein
LIQSLKRQEADENITVKLKGFKKRIIDNSPETANHVTFEHYYAAKE